MTSKLRGTVLYLPHAALAPGLAAAAFAGSPERHPLATTDRVTASAFEKDTDEDQFQPVYSRMENAAARMGRGKTRFVCRRLCLNSYGATLAHPVPSHVRIASELFSDEL